MSRAHPPNGGRMRNYPDAAAWLKVQNVLEGRMNGPGGGTVLLGTVEFDKGERDAPLCCTLARPRLPKRSASLEGRRIHPYRADDRVGPNGRRASDARLNLDDRTNSDRTEPATSERK